MLWEREAKIPSPPSLPPIRPSHPQQPKIEQKKKEETGQVTKLPFLPSSAHFTPSLSVIFAPSSSFLTNSEEKEKVEESPFHYFSQLISFSTDARLLRKKTLLRFFFTSCREGRRRMRTVRDGGTPRNKWSPTAKSGLTFFFRQRMLLFLFLRWTHSTQLYRTRRSRRCGVE